MNPVKFKGNPLGGFRVPFFLVDIGNYEAIVLPNIPLTVTSDKEIKRAVVEIPGMAFESRQFSSFGAQKISFTILLANRNPIWGNVPILKQFEKLRKPISGITSLVLAPNNANPQVLFWYGTGNMLPLIYYVDKVGFSSIAFNKLGYPTATNISMDLTLDEDTILYKSEKLASMALSIGGMGLAVLNLIDSFKKKKGY